MIEAAKNKAGYYYYTYTPSTPLRCILLLFIIPTTLAIITGFFFGLLTGADIPASHIPSTTSEMALVETEVWQDMTDNTSTARSIYGLFHWLVTVMVAVSIIGIYVGVGLPAWTYPAISITAELVVYFLVGYGGFVLVRTIEFAYRDTVTWCRNKR